MLKILNSNWRNPYLIWDNSTRAELSEFLNNRKQYAINDDDDDDIILCTEFKYSAHQGQLIVGEIFVQIYNEQPTFPIEVNDHFLVVCFVCLLLLLLIQYFSIFRMLKDLHLIS